MEGVEHFRGYPQHSSMSTVWDTITTVGDSGNDVKDVGYSQGIHSVLWRATKNTVEDSQHYQGISSVHWRVFSAGEIPLVLGIFSTVRGHNQYLGGCSALWRIQSVHWRRFQY